ncbi:MAG: SDR family oxidoreductase [Actinobacteria bacterium]|nr:SDR family oxidoreductase [Actinomycetota bacterium]
MAGSTVLLTGASSGIGAALAPMLAERGATVAITGRRADKLAEVLERCQQHQPACRSYEIDLADVAATDALPARVEADLGPVDILVSNAGAPMRRRVQDLTLPEVQSTMAVNFASPVRLTMALLPGMLERDRGVIVNVSSFGGRAGIPAEAAYCASKFALCGWSESLAMDLWSTGVDVRLVIPGAIDTDIWDRPGNDPAHFSGDLEPPETVAAAIVAAIEGDRFEHYVPDLKGIAEFKTSAIDDFLAGAVAFAEAAEAESGSAGAEGQQR